jgi:hypothetical protein
MMEGIVYNCAEIAKNILKEGKDEYRKDTRELLENLMNAAKMAERLADKFEGSEKSRIRNVRNKIQAAWSELVPLT